MSKIGFTLSGRLTAFHASQAGGVVICIEAASLDGKDLDEINRLGVGTVATVSVEYDGPDTTEAEA